VAVASPGPARGPGRAGETGPNEPLISSSLIPINVVSCKRERLVDQMNP
jgi:hypothetical protein